MKITRSNYESWFLDHIEGNLDLSAQDEFNLFLGQNPDLAEELEIGDWITIPFESGILFDAKEQLKKSNSDLETKFQEKVIAYYENDLSINERTDFEKWLLENPAFAQDSELFANLKLSADPSIVFDKKRNLKRKGIVIPLWLEYATAAAILLFAYFLYHPGEQFRPEVKIRVASVIEQISKDRVVPERKVNSEVKAQKDPTPVIHLKKVPVNIPIRQEVKETEMKPAKNTDSTPLMRNPEPGPQMLKFKGISLGQPADIELAIVPVNAKVKNEEDQVLSELLKTQLAQIRQSGDREFLSTEHLGVTGLHLFAKLTGKRLTASKNLDGTVKTVNYNSRLLAISIPVNR